MANTILKLSQPESGGTTVLLQATSDNGVAALVGSIGGFGQGGRNLSDSRFFNIRIIFKSTSKDNLRTAIRNLEEMLVRAEYRYRTGIGNPVVFNAGISTETNSELGYRIKRGALRYPASVLDEWSLNQFTIVGATLELETEAIGRSESNTSISAKTLENEVDTSASLNYFPIARGSTLEGSEGVFLDLEIRDASTATWTGSKKMWVWANEAGTTSNLTNKHGFLQDYDSLTTGLASTSSFVSTNVSTYGTSLASGGGVGVVKGHWKFASSGNMQTDGWQHEWYTQHDIESTALPDGEYKVYARARVNRNIPSMGLDADEVGLALGWQFGALASTPSIGSTVASESGDAVRFAATTLNTGPFEILELGNITYPPAPVPSSITRPTLTLRTYIDLYRAGQGFNSSGTFVEVNIDSIQLVRTDLAYVAIENVSSTNKIKIDSQTINSGVYLMSTADVFQDFATKVGTVPFQTSPNDLIIQVMRDDVGDPSNVKMVVTGSQQAITRGLGIE